MLTFTTKLDKRPIDKEVRITPDEARAMYEAGFRFSIYNPEGEEFHLTIPYRTAIAPEKGELTFMQ